MSFDFSMYFNFFIEGVFIVYFFVNSASLKVVDAEDMKPQ